MEKLKDTLQQINTRLQKMDEKLEHLVNEMTAVKQENVELKERVHKQEYKIQSIERELRKNNLVMNRVADDKSGDNTHTEEKIPLIFQKIGVEIDNVDFDEARRIGRYTEGKTRPVLLKLTKNKKKIEIQNNAKKLKGTDIWIDEDYPKEIQEERKILIPELIEARKKGYKAFLKYNKLIINEEVYEVKGLEPNNQNEKKTEKEDKASSSQKRLASERSPVGRVFEEQVRKINKTKAKN